MKNISIVAVVYNEEQRIESFIKSFSWSNDIIIIDKSSTDNTVDIIKEHDVKLMSLPYSDSGDEIKHGIEIAKNEWVMTLTASDIIHYNLVKDLLNYINDKEFDYDVISLPFAIYVLGLSDPKRSPWCLTNKPLMYKKSVIVTSNEVHKEITFNSTNIYKMKPSKDENLCHLTHETLDILTERHLRYTKLQAKQIENNSNSLKIGFKGILRSIYFVIIKKKSFLKGYDGIALGVAYISYFILRYLSIWEKVRGDGSSVYSKLRNEMLDEKILDDILKQYK